MDEFDEKAIAARLRIMADELDSGEAFVRAFRTQIGPTHCSKWFDVKSTKNGFVDIQLTWHERQ